MSLDPGISEWGDPPRRRRGTFERSEPGELKHLSSRRKRKQHVNPLVEAIEEGRAQTACVTALAGYWTPVKRGGRKENRLWKRPARRVTAPYPQETLRQGASGVARGTRNPGRRRRDHPARLNIT